MDDPTAIYNEMFPGQRKAMPIGGEKALFDAMMKQKALAAAQGASQPQAGQGQLSPMLPRSPQQQMQMQQGLAAALRRRAMQEQMMQQAQPQPGAMPPPQ